MAATGVSFTIGSTTYVADLETLRAFVEQCVHRPTGLEGDIDANGHGFTAARDAVLADEFTTLGQVNALIAGGGSPGQIPITSLNIGTATALQIIRINTGATAPEGVSQSAVGVTGFGPGSATALQLLRVNSGATGVEGYTLNLAMTIVVTAVNVTAANRQHIYVTAATKTITLPASPSAGDVVIISVGNFADTVVGRNGQNIMALAENLTINMAYASVTMQFVDATRGWTII